MSFISTNIIDSCFKKTKEFLFPINKTLWLKLGLIILLAGGASSGSSNFNINNNNFGSLSELGQIILNNLHWFILGFIGVFLISFIFVLIGSLFDFVLLDSVNKQKCMIKKSLSENNRFAISYFLFKVLINVIFGMLFIVLVTPLLIKLFSVLDDPIQMLSFAYLWVSIPLFILLSIISGVINSIIFNLMMSDMYLKKIKSFKSWRRMKRLFFKNIKEIIMYWIMRFLFGLIAGIISLLVFLFLLIIYILIGAVIFLIGFLISMLAKILIIPLVAIGILILIILFFLLIYSVVVVLVPVGVFFTNYKLEFYKSLIKK